MEYSQRVDREGGRTVSTVFGVIFSLVLLAVLGVYTVYKFTVLVAQSDVQYVLTEVKKFYSDEETFKGGKDKFNVAFGVANELDETYGTFIVYTYEEKYVDGELFEETIEIDYHPCTDEELGLEGDNASFFPNVEESFLEADWTSNLMCFDKPEEIEIRGDNNSQSLKHLNIEFQLCQQTWYQNYDEDLPEDAEININNCKSKEELAEFLDEEPYFVMISNQIRFDQEQMSEATVKSESTITWIPFQIDLILAYNFAITLTEAGL